VKNIRFQILLVAFALSILSYISVSSATVICNPCYIGNCVCSITDFTSGTFGVYTTSDCSGLPTVYYSPFSGGSITWPPSQAGTYYIRVFHESNNSNCTEQQIFSVATTTTTTTNQAQCTDGSYRCVEQNLERCTNGEWQFVKSCEYNCSVNHCVSPTTTTTKTTTTTTTTETETTSETTETTETTEFGNEEKPASNSWTTIIVVLIIISAIVLFFFYRTKQTKWQSLYSKWRR